MGYDICVTEWAMGGGKRAMRSVVLLTFVGSALFAYTPNPRNQIRDANPPSDGLSAADWSSIRAVCDANRHAAVAVEGGHQTRNPGQAWQTYFDGRGFITTPYAGDWSWGLDLVSYGFEFAESAVTAPACMEPAGRRVSYEWD